MFTCLSGEVLHTCCSLVAKCTVLLKGRPGKHGESECSPISSQATGIDWTLIYVSDWTLSKMHPVKWSLTERERLNCFSLPIMTDMAKIESEMKKW